jgi:phosphoribosylformylglycinamidine synthase
MKARVYVTLKPGILDPQGQATLKTLGRLGFEEVGDVRIGKYIELSVGGDDPDRARARVDAMCRQLIANTVIENYRIEIETDDGDAG